MECKNTRLRWEPGALQGVNNISAKTEERLAALGGRETSLFTSPPSGDIPGEGTKHQVRWSLADDHATV